MILPQKKRLKVSKFKLNYLPMNLQWQVELRGNRLNSIMLLERHILYVNSSIIWLDDLDAIIV